MKSHNVRSARLILLAAFCSLLLMGCSARIPLEKYKLLQTSTSSLSNATRDTYLRIEKLQRLYTVTTAPDTEIHRDAFKPQIDGISFDLTPELRFREDALSVLLNYANVLCAFSAKDYLEEIDLATLELAVSLKGFNESCHIAMPSRSSEMTGIFASVMNQLMREALKRGKRDALKQTMDMAQKDIDQLARLLSGSNAKIKTTIGIMLDRIIEHSNMVRPEYLTIDRIPFDMKISQVITEAEEIESSLDALGSAILQLAKAHGDLRQNLDDKKSTLDSLKEFVKETKKLSEFYRSLN